MSMMPPDESQPLNEDEKLRSAMRVLFTQVYGNDASQLKRQVAYRILARADDSHATDVLLQDLHSLPVPAPDLFAQWGCQ